MYFELKLAEIVTRKICLILFIYSSMIFNVSGTNISYSTMVGAGLPDAMTCGRFGFKLIMTVFPCCLYSAL